MESSTIELMVSLLLRHPVVILSITGEVIVAITGEHIFNGNQGVFLSRLQCRSSRLTVMS